MVELQNEEIIEERKWCVYIHTNKHNNKVYIGITNNVKNRWGSNGKKYLKIKKDGSYDQPAFARALKKYSNWIKDWEHIIFMENLTHIKAKYVERILISLYKSNCCRYKNPSYGYNLTDGGDGMVGYKYSNETKQKMSKKAKERFKDKENTPWFGKKLSDEHKKKIGDRNKGKYTGEKNPMYDVHLTGSKNPMYGVCRCGENNPMYGKKHSEQTKQKIRNSLRGKYVGDKNPMYGKQRFGPDNPHYGKGKAVVQLDEAGNILFEYVSASAAEKETGIRASNIYKCCKGYIKTCGGFRWEYKDEYEQQFENLNKDKKEK